MRILLLSPFFYPEKISTGKYNTSIVEALLNSGHEVAVISSHPLYPDWNVTATNNNLPNVEIIRGGRWVRYPRSPKLRRVVLELWYAWHTLTSYLWLKSRPQTVVAVFPPSLFFLSLNWLMPKSIHRVGIIHDLQGVYASNVTGILGKILLGSIRYVERRCFSACDQLIFLSTAMKDRAVAEYQLSETDLSVCYPFVSNNRTEHSDALIDILHPDTFNVVYSGALGEKQNPDDLLSFLSHIASTHDKVACHIFSAGPIFEKLRSNYQDTVNCKVQFHDLVPNQLLSELYSRSDAQIIPQADQTADGSLPSKLPNLLAAGVSIFAICERGSELGEIVNAAQVGAVANTWDLTELSDLFRVFRYNCDAESRVERQLRLQPLIESKFSINCVINNILGAAKLQKVD